MSPIQHEAVEAARQRLASKPWFKGISVEELLSDDEIRAMGVDKAAVDIATETALRDAPGWSVQL